MSAVCNALRNLQHAPRPLRTAIRRLPSLCRSATNSSKSMMGRTLEVSQIKAGTPIAKKLLDTGLYVPSRAKVDGASATAKKKAAKTKIKGDKTRVHIVSEELCDDILKYIGKDLERHKGCDLIDLYPGVGAWSSKLHEFLQPRSHILMEPDDKMYAPFLEPLLEKPGTTLVPKSGILWKELATVMNSEFLPHQQVRTGAARNERNDTLLVTMNLCFHPKKKYSRFDSIVRLITHQLLEAIRSSGLFQQYGQVRMLIWMRSDEVSFTLARNNAQRKKTPIFTEMYCEWVREVCTPAIPPDSWYSRDNGIDQYMMARVIDRMKKDNIELPRGRETQAYLDVKEGLESGVKYPAPGIVRPTYRRNFQVLMDELEEQAEAGKILPGSADFNTLRDHRNRQNNEWKKEQHFLDAFRALDRARQRLHKEELSPEEIKEVTKEWVNFLHGGPKSALAEFNNYRSNIEITRPETYLHSDRRSYEPLGTKEGEFFPNIDCSLLDIQPKPLHPLLRQTGPKSNRAGDTMEFLMGYMLSSGSLPVDRVLDSMWPGATDYIMPRWTSLRDPGEGGYPYLQNTYAAPMPRVLSARQWEQLLELWMEWPFRPDFPELIARFHEVESDDDDHTRQA